MEEVQKAPEHTTPLLLRDRRKIRARLPNPASPMELSRTTRQERREARAQKKKAKKLRRKERRIAKRAADHLSSLFTQMQVTDTSASRASSPKGEGNKTTAGRGPAATPKSLAKAKDGTTPTSTPPSLKGQGEAGPAGRQPAGNPKPKQQRPRRRRNPRICSALPAGPLGMLKVAAGKGAPARKPVLEMSPAQLAQRRAFLLKLVIAALKPAPAERTAAVADLSSMMAHMNLHVATSAPMPATSADPAPAPVPQQSMPQLALPDTTPPRVMAGSVLPLPRTPGSLAMAPTAVTAAGGMSLPPWARANQADDSLIPLARTPGSLSKAAPAAAMSSSPWARASHLSPTTVLLGSGIVLASPPVCPSPVFDVDTKLMATHTSSRTLSAMEIMGDRQSAQ